MARAIYNVTIAKYAHIYVEAKSAEELESIVDKFYFDDDMFEDSDVEVHSWDTYTYDAEDLEDEDTIYAVDENGDGVEYSPDEYMDMLEELFPDGVPDVEPVYQKEEFINFPEE